MSWICGGCKAENLDSDRFCRGCSSRTQFTKVRTAAEAPPGEEKKGPVSFSGVSGIPAYLGEARFATKGQWTSGALYAVPEGIFLLSAEDDIATPEKASSRKIPPGEEPLAVGRSQWIPLKCITRVTHNELAGHKIHLAKGNIPIRFDSAGWAALGSICLHLKLEFTA